MKFLEETSNTKAHIEQYVSENIFRKKKPCRTWEENALRWTLTFYPAPTKMAAAILGVVWLHSRVIPGSYACKFSCHYPRPHCPIICYPRVRFLLSCASHCNHDNPQVLSLPACLVTWSLRVHHINSNGLPAHSGHVMQRYVRQRHSKLSEHASYVIANGAKKKKKERDAAQRNGPDKLSAHARPILLAVRFFFYFSDIFVCWVIYKYTLKTRKRALLDVITQTRYKHILMISKTIREYISVFLFQL